jgi:hypothetical protein
LIRRRRRGAGRPSAASGREKDASKTRNQKERGRAVHGPLPYLGVQSFTGLRGNAPYNTSLFKIRNCCQCKSFFSNLCLREPASHRTRIADLFLVRSREIQVAPLTKDAIQILLDNLVTILVTLFVIIARLSASTAVHATSKATLFFSLPELSTVGRRLVSRKSCSSSEVRTLSHLCLHFVPKLFSFQANPNSFALVAKTAFFKSFVLRNFQTLQNADSPENLQLLNHSKNSLCKNRAYIRRPSFTRRHSLRKTATLLFRCSFLRFFAIFCRARKYISFVVNRLRALAKKTPGVYTSLPLTYLSHCHRIPNRRSPRGILILARDWRIC